MRRKISSFIIAITFFAAGAMFAQSANADKNSAGPTKNDLKIRITEPLEGATISGSTARVAVDYDRSLYREQGGVDKGLDKFPAPTFDVFLDNDLKGVLKGSTNVATIENIPPGSHKIVILAKNISGEVVDRKEIHITTVAATSTMAETTTTSAAPAPAPPLPAPAPSYEPAPAPAAPAETTLPKTGSIFPRLSLLGLALVAGGLLLGRKAR